MPKSCILMNIFIFLVYSQSRLPIPCKLPVDLKKMACSVQEVIFLGRMLELFGLEENIVVKSIQARI